ncbi:uncharacterized protein LOC123005289 [Tribolium madens]|uniref:uncharacterized protein LOC123005289 n=1 Tax=Tribolium madens TaxID=41895 RepID=UPI001CF75F04|nr:uncharacterized protein LOC123005289 [Tribolium madens]
MATMSIFGFHVINVVRDNCEFKFKLVLDSSSFHQEPMVLIKIILQVKKEEFDLSSEKNILCCRVIEKFELTPVRTTQPLAQTLTFHGCCLRQTILYITEACSVRKRKVGELTADNSEIVIVTCDSTSSIMTNKNANYLLAAAGLLMLTAAYYGGTKRITRCWKTRPIYTTRRKNGFYRASFLPMKKQDSEQFFKYTRMTVQVFDHFCQQLKEKLVKRRISDGICPEEKIAITLQYLSQGVSMQSLAWTYKMGLTTVHSIIHEVCKVIWDVLAPQYLSEPSTEEWQHINIQAPANNSGSLNVPKDTYIPNTSVKVPYALVADKAFPQKKYIMRPYGGRHLSMEKRIFNYRLSRARRMIENTFGIMVARWRILKQTIVADVTNNDHMVKAVVVLHNFCLQQGCCNIYCPSGYVDVDDKDNGQWRSEIKPLPSVGRVSTNTATRLCYHIRDLVCEYFSSNVGALPWQNERALRR